MKRLAFGLLWLSGAVSVWAQVPSVPNAPVSIEDYRHIEATRTREGADFDAQDAACYQRFAVNDCLKKVQSKRIAVMADLKRQDALLQDRERAQRGVEALERIEQKALERKRGQEENQVSDGVARAQEKLEEQLGKRAEHSAKAARAASDPAPVSVPSPTGPTTAEQTQARARYESRQADAQRKRQEVIQRQAVKVGKPVQPLPLPH
jgi:hypothetical protein